MDGAHTAERTKIDGNNVISTPRSTFGEQVNVVRAAASHSLQSPTLRTHYMCTQERQNHVGWLGTQHTAQYCTGGVVYGTLNHMRGDWLDGRYYTAAAPRPTRTNSAG